MLAPETTLYMQLHTSLSKGVKYFTHFSTFFTFFLSFHNFHTTNILRSVAFVNIQFPTFSGNWSGERLDMVFKVSKTLKACQLLVIMGWLVPRISG